MYCDQTDLGSYVYQPYLAKAEELAPGCVGIHVAQVSAEIDEALVQGGYSSPEAGVSATLRRMCAVMAAWRVVGQITSLMDTEASSSNEWLPLQRLNSRAEKDLDAIRAGRLNPFPDAVSDSIVVDAPKPIFSHHEWRKF